MKESAFRLVLLFQKDNSILDNYFSFLNCLGKLIQKRHSNICGIG